MQNWTYSICDKNIQQPILYHVNAVIRISDLEQVLSWSQGDSLHKTT